MRKMEVEGKVERRGGKRKRVGAGLEVELLVCSVGFRLVRRKNALDEEEKGTVQAGGRERRSTPRGVHAHTRVTCMLGLHPSHESKLFETEKEIRGGEEGTREREGNVKWG